MCSENIYFKKELKGSLNRKNIYFKKELKEKIAKLTIFKKSNRFLILDIYFCPFFKTQNTFWKKHAKLTLLLKCSHLHFQLN